MMKRRNSITIAVPASMVSEINNLRDKTTVLRATGKSSSHLQGRPNNHLQGPAR